MKKLTFPPAAELAIMEGRKIQARIPWTPQPGHIETVSGWRWVAPRFLGDWGETEQMPQSFWKMLVEVLCPYKAGDTFKAGGQDYVIKSIRAERLQDCSPEGAAKEGCLFIHGLFSSDDYASDRYFINLIRNEEMMRDRFMVFWNCIHGDDFPFESNPWVWVIDFRKENGHAKSYIQVRASV